MEQQKVLFYVFSIVIVIVALIAVAVVFLPEPQEVSINQEEVPVPAEAGTDVTDPSTWVQDPENVPEFTPEESEDGIVVIGVADEEDEQQIEEGIEVVQAGDEDTREEIPTSVPTASQLQKPKQTPEAARAVRESSTASAVPAPAKPKVVRRTEYWIQAGSFTSRSRAEYSQEELKKEGFNCLITSKTVGGTSYFRLRLGPYENKNEAEKFLGWIRGLDNYRQSYISEVYVEKTL